MFSYIWFPALISAMGGYLFMSVAPLSTQFMALFGVGYAGMSLFLSGLLWSHSLVQLPAGLILDKLGVYRGFLIAIIIALVSNLLPFLAPENLALATALRFFGGLSSGVLFLAGVKVTAMMAPPEKIAPGTGYTRRGLQPRHHATLRDTSLSRQRGMAIFIPDTCCHSACRHRPLPALASLGQEKQRRQQQQPCQSLECPEIRSHIGTDLDTGHVSWTLIRHTE